MGEISQQLEAPWESYIHYWAFGRDWRLAYCAVTTPSGDIYWIALSGELRSTGVLYG